eukprot:Phypoly_transcript_01521.p1 GENE.Phypoly_transcript_01521~~Phypoly_transcript_01521.p1  ORF type:complete len:1104 (+),score=247.66 Phypoly_transcript_01521:276-3314(+)
MTKKWRPYEDPDGEADPQLNFPESDRAIVKENIVEALVHAPPTVQAQLASAITNICNADFPEKWESLIPKITNLIHSQNPAFMHGALLALLMAFKKYSFLTDGKKRAPLHAVIATIFPLLLQVFSHLSSNDSLESAAIQRLLCKIFYVSINMSIPPYMTDPNVLNQWISLLQVLLEKQIPDSIQPTDPEARAKFPWWSAKKWAARSLERFVRRYMRPRKVDKKSNKKFADVFSGAGYAVKAMETFLRVMAVKRGGGGYLPDKFTQTVLCYLRMCIRYGTTYVALKPHLEVLTQEILFPYLCLSDADNELWQEDPVEYLRKEFDPIAEYNNPRTESINFITDLVMLRGRPPLNNFMKFVVELLKKYTSTPENQRNYREKDGCLHAIGSLSPWLYRVPDYRQNLEVMLLVHVFPEFSSPHGFLRARACWIFSQFHKVKFTNAANFSGAVQKVLSMMHDPELPVRVQAGLSLRFLIFADKIEDLLRPLLTPILEAIFKLMNEIESDDLVATLESLIDKFGEEMAPYAVGLCSRLTESFMKFYKSADETEADDDSAAAAALECLMALRSLLRGVRNMPHIYAQLNPIILPMLQETLNDNSIEYFEELLRTLTFCTFYGDVAPMWPLFPLICNAHELWASDYIADMIPPIDNYISRGTETFLSGPYPDMVMAMYKKAVGNNDTNEEEAGQATELVESMLHNCKGRVDRFLPEMISLAVQRLNTEIESDEFKVLLIEVVANALYYNPVLALQILESQGTTQAVFAKWLELIPLFKRPFDIKLVVLGLAAIFELPLASLPPIIQQGSKFILEAIVKLLQKAEKLRKEAADRKLDREHEEAVAKKEEAEKKANGTAAAEEDEDSEDEIEMNEIPDDQDAEAIDSDEDEMEMAMLHANVAQIMGDDQPVDLGDDSSEEALVEGEEFEDDDEDDDDDYDDDDDSDDEEYSTVIDKVDELVYFAGRIHNLHNTNNAGLQSLMGTLGAEGQKAVHELVELAKTREVENAQKEQQKLQKAAQNGK